MSERTNHRLPAERGRARTSNHRMSMQTAQRSSRPPEWHRRRPALVVDPPPSAPDFCSTFPALRSALDHRAGAERHAAEETDPRPARADEPAGRSWRAADRPGCENGRVYGARAARRPGRSTWANRAGAAENAEKAEEGNDEKRRDHAAGKVTPWPSVRRFFVHESVPHLFYGWRGLLDWPLSSRRQDPPPAAE